MIDVLLGLQWGDEGKGKIVDVLAPQYDIIARFQGGPNAGHTLIFNDRKFILHTIPSGIFRENTINIIGNGVVIDPVIFKSEIDKIKVLVNPKNNLKISSKAHLILPSHRLLDAAYEQQKGGNKIGSTLKGIGPTYTDKYARLGLRVGDILSENFKNKYDILKQKHFEIINNIRFDYSDYLIDNMSYSDYEKAWFDSLELLKEFDIIESEYYINNAFNAGKKILAEGAQGSLLDVDFGSYPYVTSSNTIASGVCSGLGVAPNKIGRIFGIFKAYCTRVGSGPFPTELFDEKGKSLQKKGNEFGSTTGRPRRCGWLDIPALKYSAMLSGITDLIITKIDVLNELKEIPVCTSYKIANNKTQILPFNIAKNKIGINFEVFNGWNSSLTDIAHINNLPKELLDYLKFIEKQTAIPITMVSYGPDRKQIITFNI
ncbi:MAG: adenylosuccinate synthase [Bacteroidetes bacterium HGW-Bacteroidetes-12]|nr:MAG: adenylosuccinate synthase [Bacteroidetes bacterium HGW-Bacteroidetes-12]